MPARAAQPLLQCFATLQVSDQNNAALYTGRAQEKGQFAFTSKAAGEYKACFTTAGE